MIAVIKGDIIASRTLSDQSVWLNPIKNLLSQWGKEPQQWELVWGDSFQVEIDNPQDALIKALTIKALIKNVEPRHSKSKAASIDVRLAVGIGEKTFSGSRISESNGPAFIFAGERFDLLRKENLTLGIKSPWIEFDDEFNRYLMLAGTFMDKWSVSSAQLMLHVLQNPNSTQKRIGDILGIKQNSVSGRWNRANVNEILDVENVYRKKISTLMS